MQRRDFLGRATAATALTAGLGSAGAAFADGERYSPSVLIAWNTATTAAFAASIAGPTEAARAMSMIFEAVYNAWAAYTDGAKFTLVGMRKRSSKEQRRSLKSIAVNHAAYGVLVDLFPARIASFAQTLAQTSEGLETATVEGIAAQQTGQLAANLMVMARASDGSNQQGLLAPGAYSDWTGYRSVNTPDVLVDPNRWQPLRLTSSAGVTAIQQFHCPHWGQVRPFALGSGSALRPTFSPAGPTSTEIQELLTINANLSDEHKVQVEFWANNPGSVTPPGQWSEIAAQLSAADGNSLDRDVVMFFVLGQAMLDASIAAWDAKRAYDSVRPISTIRTLFRGQTILGWRGVGRGTEWILGEEWRPYQRDSNPSPNFPEFVSGHSTFSAAAATVLAALRGDRCNLSFSFAPASIRFDPTMPLAPVTLSWRSLRAAADAAGYSRRYGGIHFAQGDVKGRTLGNAVGVKVLQKARTLYASSDD